MQLQRLVRRFVFVLIFGSVLLYSGFALRNALRGPLVTLTPITSPVTTPIVTLRGSAVRAEMVTVNSLSIPLTTEGTFALTTALTPGDNEFVIEASDRFGSTYQEHLHVYHIPPPEAAPKSEESSLIDNP